MARKLCFKEYFSAVESHIDADKVITPIFKQKKGDIYKVVSFSAKKARGAFARYIIENRITEIHQLYILPMMDMYIRKQNHPRGCNFFF